MKRAIFSIAILVAYPGFACTTFATFNGINDTLVMAKNRDNRADRQIVQVVAEVGKIKYLALSRQDYPNFVSAGINQKNLAVFNEVTVEYSDKAKGAIDDDFSKDILQNYTNAKDVIPDIPKLIAKYPDPVFYQVADSKQILSIEVAPDHKYAYKLIEKGSFAHTNNYQDKKLIKGYKYTVSEKARRSDSQTRFNRALSLVSQESEVSLMDMQMIATDHNAGNNNSIYRSGLQTDPRSVRSLAFFGIEIARDGRGPSRVNVNLYNMDEKYSYVLDNQFWSKYNAPYTILVPDNDNKK